MLVTIGDGTTYSEVDNIGLVNGLPADGQYTIAALFTVVNVPVGLVPGFPTVVGGTQTRVDVNVRPA